MPVPQSANSLNRSGTPTQPAFQELKVRVHRQLLERLDLSAMASLDRTQSEAQIRQALQRLLSDESTPLSRTERDRLIEEIGYEVLGLGPLDPLLRDPDVSDILVNGPNQVYVEKFGRLHLTDVKFRDNDHLMRIIERIVSGVGRRVDESSPMVDARLPDGSRVNAIIPPLALDGPALSIRRFGKDPYKIEDLVGFRALTEEMVRYLKAIVGVRLNIIVSGGTGCGKTTLLNCLTAFIPDHERVVTIEDSAELQLQQPHTVRLETRPPNLEGKGEVTARDLVRNCLRMRPDRIVVGECRSAEVIDMLQAMNTGHDGSITTVHANNPRDCLGRLEMMVLMGGIEMPIKAIRQQVASAVNVIVQASRMSDGTRKVVKITEVVGMEADQVTSQDVFEFIQTGVNAEGMVQGHFRPTGVRSQYYERLIAAGVRPEDLRFENVARQAPTRRF
jgi:pilus assembly protein CpaF